VKGSGPLSVYGTAGKCPGSGCGIAEISLSPEFPLGVDLETFIRRDDAERFIEEVRGEDPDLASYLRIEERELEAAATSLSAKLA
jgi:hypothetical protein